LVAVASSLLPKWTDRTGTCLDTGSTVVDGHPARYLLGEKTGSEGPQRSLVYLMIHDKIIYTMGCFVSQDRFGTDGFDQHKKLFIEIKDSFHFRERF
jgi:hypothetical protein